MRTKILATDQSSPTNVRWVSRSRLIIIFWLAAIISLGVMAATGPAGWDAQISWKAIQYLRHGLDPYAAGIAAQQASPNRPAPSPTEHVPFTRARLVYDYSPLTIPLLLLLGALPDWLLVLIYGTAVAAGFLLQLRAGFQLAGKHERLWLALLLPAVAFFPGLITDDAILSGNVAYILYGLVLTAAVPGWKRGRWFWYYLAVLAASIIKAPMLTLLAFPILVGRRQWLSATSTAAAGLSLIAAQAWLWPELFREYLATIRILFDLGADFGYGPAGVVGRALWNKGQPYSPATTITYLAFAGAIGVALLFLARRVRQTHLSRETWIPVALVGTFLLYPRIMKYDMAAITVPMLLIGWRTLRSALTLSSGASPDQALRLAEEPARPGSMAPAGAFWRSRPNLTLLIAGAVCFLIPNLITVAGPPWWPVELVVMLAIFAMGIWSLSSPSLSAPPSIVPARVIYEEVDPIGAVEPIT